MVQLICISLIALFSAIYADERPIVSLEDGVIRGSYKKSFNGRKYAAFEGIPYAQPPIQKLRFKDPQPVIPWKGVLEATSHYTCIQMSMMGQIVIGQEDCLYLNVYVPQRKVNSSEKLDVIVHIHGGAFMVGNPNDLAGPSKIMDRDLIFVNLNYRLGPLGFLSNADSILPGNYGLKDQTFALQWVQRNIEKFGGNSKSVTITGVSAGAASVHLHYFSSLSKGLFQRGLASSGAALNPWVIKKDPWVNGKLLAREVGCYSESTGLVLQCLQERSALQLLNALQKFYKGILLPLAPFAPTIEQFASTSFLTTDPYLLLKSKVFTDVPLILTMTTEEGLLPAIFYYPELKQFSEKLKYLFPMMLEYDSYSDVTQERVTEKLLEHYFNNQPITYENFNKFTELCSHRLFHVGGEKSIKLQANASTAEIYFIMMGYGGGAMIPGLEHLGVGHASDGIFYYDFKTLNVGKPLTKEEVKMKDVLLDMLVAYAKTGKPIIEGSDFQPIAKDGSLNYLFVKGPSDIKMLNKQTLGGVEFWRSLGLREDENAY